MYERLLFFFLVHILPLLQYPESRTSTYIRSIFVLFIFLSFVFSTTQHTQHSQPIFSGDVSVVYNSPSLLFFGDACRRMIEKAQRPTLRRASVRSLPVLTVLLVCGTTTRCRCLTEGVTLHRISRQYRRQAGAIQACSVYPLVL